MRKGISNIVSIALLLAVGISLTGLYSDWAPNFAENNTQKIADNSNQEIKCRNAALSIRSPVYDRSSNLTVFEVENSGTIRLSEGIQIAAINNSNIQNRTSISRLEVGEGIDKEIYSKNAPETLLVASEECPSIDERETLIQTQN